MVMIERPQPQTPRLPWRILKEAEDWLWSYPDNLARYDARRADFLRGANLYESDEPVSRTAISWSDPTGNCVAALLQDEQLCDLWRAIRPVHELRDSLSPGLAAVLRFALLEEHTRTSGAYVIAQAAHVRREQVRPAKEAILARFARQMGMV